ncbi:MULTISPECIES: hypothetical protein [Flavobacterium]|uniref:hypothetical protein n=1 Tax=Flavobacterium TaxID=237 RepID=UPI0015AB9232|nr:MULTISPECIES: hypothetical protein [Flavobacterium]MBN9285288.1 hypothetical protein [Flavobacterium sp.]
MKNILLFQHATIEEKIKNAPDNNYEIGVFIGSLLPFVVLVIIAYLMYHRARKRNRE